MSFKRKDTNGKKLVLQWDSGKTGSSEIIPVKDQQWVIGKEIKLGTNDAPNKGLLELNMNEAFNISKSATTLFIKDLGIKMLHTHTQKNPILLFSYSKALNSCQDYNKNLKSTGSE